ncbi:hypothetical protein Droror1_Dr00000610, partial [Drosera rotundifolia]
MSRSHQPVTTSPGRRTNGPGSASRAQKGKGGRRAGNGSGNGHVEMKKRIARPGTAALREIRRFQKSCDRLIPTAAFNRNVREVCNYFSLGRIFWTPDALSALQE